MCITLARKGYFAGDPEKVYNAPVDVVFRTLDYENFIKAYEDEEIKLNAKN